MGKCLTLRAKKVAGGKKKMVMEVYIDAKDWPFHNNKKKDNDDSSWSGIY
jgi:hypothetical protein